MANTVAKYQKYAEYQDSGIEWLGEIPSHWESKKLKYLLDDLVRGPFGSALKKDFFVDSGFKVYEQKNCIRNDVKIGDSYVPKKIYEELERFSVKPYDLLMSCSGTIGKVVQVPDQFEIGIINQALLIMRLDYKFLSSQFFLYSFRSDDIQNQIKDNTQGGAMQNLVATDIFKSISFAIPPIIEQTQIANFLDHETAKIDSLIAKQEKLIELLKEKRQAVISHAVTKGLNPNVPMKDSGVEWLGEVPEHWQVGRIKHLAQIISKGTTPTTMGGDFVEEGIRFLKAENIGKGFRVNNYPEFFISEKVDEQLARSRLKEHDVLVIIAGATTGLASVLQKELLPANTNQAVSFIRLLNFNYSHWVSHWLTTQFAQSVIWMGAVQAAQPNLSMESLGNIYIAIPPVEEVIEILKDIEFKLESFESLINKAQQQISLMQERRTALISAAVTGKIDVRNWQALKIAEAETELSA
ncbi:restriction endonuclease subunit S [Acinetobacter sp. WCHAc010052]|uniref:restriction endonuclease subunit S n=1 Tax=Acinetobacter sp. WCHAc010052 TaxID=2004647 RepID=UPI000B3C88B0|nr:restriction endonuclease subunit S [Acinetobacter sp. WCHAc010052]AXY59586.1 restriction endonuclease subunit S [Acinetobacter sp. WCHAc010052]